MTETFGRPQKIKLGYIPLLDCAPFVVAQEYGLFTKYGCSVHLTREVGWATIRDKLIYGELHGAHTVSPMPFAINFGMGCIPVPCISPLVITLNGNSITLSRRLYDAGVRDGEGLKKEIDRNRGKKTFVLGVVFQYSSHNFILKQWLATHGIHPDRDVRIVVVPPQQLTGHLKSGNIDGFCVSEPWTSFAVKEEEGFCVATSSELSPGHPDKVFTTTRQFADEREEELLAITAALIEAVKYCENRGNLKTIATLLGRKEHLNVSPEVLMTALEGPFIFSPTKAAQVPDFLVFSKDNSNEPCSQKAAWILGQLLRSGSLRDPSLLRTGATHSVFRPDLYQKALLKIESEIQPLNHTNELVSS